MSSDNEKITRKLRAILSADVKGYSLLMADDEVHTIQTLKAYRVLMSELITHHSGRVVDNPGDNMLAEFESAVDAVECAVKIQNKLKKENAKFVDDRRLQFRIGVNIGDVVHDGGRIYGDGVNIAARIESLADAGGICISRSTYDQIKNKLELEAEYLGEHSVKNIEEPVRVYRVLTGTDAPKPLIEEQLELPDKPSIAVLPFTNMSGDPGQEYFSDGLTEQIINGLCKVSNLFVIARNSSFAYKGKAVSVKQIAKELGVRYILEGSVQKAGDRVRITAQLIDATTDYHMWSENYDRKLEDIFALQDEITMKLMVALQVNLTEGQQASLRAKHTNNLAAYVNLLQAGEYLAQFSKDGNILARQKFQECITLEPDYASAYAGLAATYLKEAWQGWTEFPEQSGAMAMQHALKCIELDNSLPSAHSALGLIHLVLKQWDKAIEESELAVSLNPNDADCVVILSVVYRTVGRIEEALSLLDKSMRLNPLPPNWYLHEYGTCFRLLGRYDEAIAVLKRILEISPDYLNSRLNLILTYAMSRKEDDARKEAVKVLKLSPDFSIGRFLKDFPYKDQEILDGMRNALRLAGLPD
ncbi:MAG: tetratricopeptide repeat protein [Thermodesulfobacteriota bacterium]